MKVATCEASANIAVVKYWGKRDEKNILPMNTSLSFTIAELRTRTTVVFSPTFPQDGFWLNNSPVDIGSPKVVEYFTPLKYLRTLANLEDHRVRVVSCNCFPTAAGFASSAAGVAAMVCAGAKAAGLNLSSEELSRLARLGSGSAARSVMGGFVEWKKGSKKDGEDSFAVQVAPARHWPELRDVIAVVDAREKKIGSRLGMKQTVATSALYRARLHSLPKTVHRMKAAVLDKDFPTFGEITMRESNNLHAVMLDTWPPIIYLNDVAHEVMGKIHDMNDAAGEIVAAYTFDAGPNAHIYTTEGNVGKVTAALQSVPGVCRILVCTIGEGPKFLADEREFLTDPSGRPRQAQSDEKLHQILVLGALSR